MLSSSTIDRNTCFYFYYFSPFSGGGVTAVHDGRE